MKSAKFHKRSPQTQNKEESRSLHTQRLSLESTKERVAKALHLNTPEKSRASNDG